MRSTHPVRTSPPAPRLPGRRRAPVWVAVSVGAGVVAVVAYDARRLLRLRRDAPRDATPLDHTALVGEGLAQPLDLLVLGDSAAAGYGNADPRDAFPYQVGARLAATLGARVRVDSLAESGASTRDVTCRQVPRARGSGVDVVILSVGVNDALGRRRSSTVRTDTLALVEAVGAAVPGARTVLVGCPDLSCAPGLPRPANRVIGWRCRRVRAGQAAAAAEARVPFVAHPRAPQATMFGPDGLHPGPAGQAVAAAAVAAALGSSRNDRPHDHPHDHPLDHQEDRWTSA